MTTFSPATALHTPFDALLAPLTSEIERQLAAIVPAEPRSLYEPVRDVIAAGGKRVRPLLTALTSRLQSRVSDWIHPAVAVELLHTFTLVHDDIMDNAASRRNRPTAHVTYGVSTAILAGDVLISLALESLGRTASPLLREMLREFALGFRLVCDGQALDKEFETRMELTVDEYLTMIDLKTSKVLELAAVLGAYAGGGDFVEPVRSFAHHAGLAFQINDDLLDLTAQQADFGKTIGGDILEGKRTYLFVSAMQRYASANADERALLDRIRDRRTSTADIAASRALFQKLGVLQAASEAAQSETISAVRALDALPDSPARENLRALADKLLSRSR